MFEVVLLQNVVEFLGLEFCEGVDALFQLANVGLVSVKPGLYLALVYIEQRALAYMLFAFCCSCFRAVS